MLGELSELYSKPLLVLGCGNTLFGDDGFGPEVVRHLEAAQDLPAAVGVLDAGTGVRDLLFDLVLLSERPAAIVVVDAVSDTGRPPGTLMELEVERLPAAKTTDFSLHQFPSVNLLRELKQQAGVAVRVLVVQTEVIPDQVRPGLSGPVAAAVPAACRWVRETIGGLL